MPYTYIARVYRRHFEAGQRVWFTEYDGDRGKGVVRGVKGDPQYVRVLFDDGYEGDCHPDSLVVLPAAASAQGAPAEQAGE